jgi:hypothetical protein
MKKAHKTHKSTAKKIAVTKTVKKEIHKLTANLSKLLKKAR